MSSFHRLARIEATAGLQISQPWPRPWTAINSSNVLMLLDLDDLEQFLARAGKVFAQRVADLLAGRLDLGLEQIGHERQAAAATSAGPRARLDFVDRAQILFADGRTNLFLADVVAGANLGIVGNRGEHVPRTARGAASAHEHFAAAPSPAARCFWRASTACRIPTHRRRVFRRASLVPSELNTSFL